MEIPQPESAFEDFSQTEEDSQPVENAVEEISYQEEPFELEVEDTVAEFAENYEEEIFESENPEKEDFYSRNDALKVEENVSEYAEETQFEESENFEPFEETEVEENDYIQFDSVEDEAEEDFEETSAAETEFFEEDEIFAAADTDTDEIVMDESVEENFEATENGDSAIHLSVSEQTSCPFCRTENDVLAFTCGGCKAVLTLSDLEMLLAHKDTDVEMLRRAVEQMEVNEVGGDCSSDELMILGIGCINLKNIRNGLEYLRKAAKLDPNNVLLNSQVHSLAIRLAEIEQQESIHRSMPQDRTIMVVDDSATVRKLISGKLEKSGHTVVCAVDGVEALEKLKEFTPDLVLLDITMPRMDGYQVCKLIRNDPAMKDIPVVMISGKDGFFDKVRGRMAGTTGYITKPFGPETLMKTVEAFVAPRAESAEEEIFEEEEFEVEVV